MVMRGVPATPEKGMYIFFDVQRKAHEAAAWIGMRRNSISENRSGRALSIKTARPCMTLASGGKTVCGYLPVRFSDN
jgi:hypothetical protein